MQNKYNNYHKHDHISGIFTPDTHIKTLDYINRAIELGHDTYFTTNHGSGGDIFESNTICEKYGLHCKFGVEGYIVENPLEKDNRNYHIMIIPVDNVARKKINLITSRASIEGFYYKPRIFIDDLLRLNKDEIYLTSACTGGILRDDNGYKNIFLPLVSHFGKNFMLEVQNHNENNQIILNKKCLEISKRLNLNLIAANDSHYIYPNQSKDRLEFLKGKGIDYGSEDTYILDYPDYNTMYDRFIQQGVLNEIQTKDAIKNTLLFDKCEDIYIDKNIKMPSIYPNLTSNEKVKELKKHVAKRFRDIVEEENISKEDYLMYKNGIEDEMKVIEDTKEINTADYFLFNEKNVELAINKYNGVLTRTGRGSCGSFYINRILGMTQLDRFKTGIKLYPERFMSTARLLENRALPDIDFNVVSQEPFVAASKELLGEHGCYPMVAYGTMQLGEAFRNVCRSQNIPFDEFNDVAKNIENKLNDNKWIPYIKEANKFVDTIVSASVHPCAFVLDNKDLREEYGVVRIGKSLCVMITSGEADEYKVLKNDYLVVSVWKLISETFELIGKPILTIKQLLSMLDNNVWKLFDDGITCTLNQVDGEWATSMLKDYKPRSSEEMAMYVSSVRPSFNAWRDLYIWRKEYSTGSEALDKVLEATNHFILFQENLMQYFEWLGVSPSESIGLIKKISKKKIKQDDFDKLENGLRKNWISKTGSEEMFNETWEMIQGCISYGFCSAHGLATGIDCLYGAYLKANYPLEYYTVCLTNYSDNMEKTIRLTEELNYFNIKLLPIKFGKSSSKYSIDHQNNSIYKGIASIKFCNSQIADELYQLAHNNTYNSFIDLLIDITTKTSVDNRQLMILTGLNFFSEFGENKYLLNIIDIYNNIYSKKQFKKNELEKLNLSEYLMKKYSNKETEKLYKEVDTPELTKELCLKLENKPMSIIEHIKFEMEYLGHTTYINPNVSDFYYVVVGFKTFKDVTKPYLILRNIKTGEEVNTKIKQGKIFKNNPFGEYAILKIIDFAKGFKKKCIGGEWIVTDEIEDILESYEIIKNN